MRKKATIFIILGFLIVLVGFSLYLYFLSLPLVSKAPWRTFEIKPATPTLLIGQKLKDEGFIRSKWLFLFGLKLKRKTIQAGVYEISPSFNLSQIIKKLTAGEVKEWLITFPEGFSLKDMAERLEKKKIVKKEEFLSEASSLSKYQKDFPFLKEARGLNLEGYLFPDTYRFPYKTDSSLIISKMLANFEKKVGFIDFPTLILASIVEREAKNEEDRRLIASVYLNRLKKGMKLEADPTIQYAKGNWEPVKKEEYESIDSPYNTYKYPGLPPSPVCNPGLSSILAAKNPKQTDYLYFFHKKDGQTVYSKTKEEHERKKREE